MNKRKISVRNKNGKHNAARRTFIGASIDDGLECLQTVFPKLDLFLCATNSNKGSTQQKEWHTNQRWETKAG